MHNEVPSDYKKKNITYISIYYVLLGLIYYIKDRIDNNSR